MKFLVLAFLAFMALMAPIQAQAEFEETETQTGGPSTGEIIKHAGLFKNFAGMNINRTPSPDPAEAREELLEKYNALLKERKELKRRNGQAQTNICNYLRKHSIDLFPRVEKSQV